MNDEATISLCIEMLSDWSIGTGTGRQGSLDSLTERDADGFPVIPSTSFRGMWRDAAEAVALGLDDGVPAAWSNLVPQIFGSQPAIDKITAPPLMSRLSVADARLPAALRQFVRENHKHRFRDAMFFVRPGVKIDRSTGGAEQDFLRFDEVARAGSVLQTQCRLALTGDLDFDTAILALSLASLSMVERIGGDRRRGRGACRLSVEAMEAGEVAKAFAVSGSAATAISDAVAWLEKTTSPAAAPSHASATSGFRFRAERSDTFRRYALDVELVSATCIAHEVQGNIVTTQKMISGSILLGAVFPALSAATGLDIADLRAMVASGDLRVLDATPTIDGWRSAPAPLILEAKKENPTEIRNKVFSPAATEQHKALRETMIVASGTSLKEAPKAATVLRTHNTVDDEIQKPTEDSGGGVFVLEALKPGTRLASEIWLRGVEIRAPISSYASVGRAKNAGYGRVHLTVEPIALSAPRSNRSEGDKTLIWVRSDIVLPVGCVTIADALRVLLAPYGLDTARLSPNSEVRLGRHEGWVAAWGLPRPTVTTITAGSVIMLEGVGRDADLERLAVNGLGDRRAEGFGVVSVNDEILFAETVILEKDQHNLEPQKATTDRLDIQADAIPMRSGVEAVERIAIEALIAEKAELSVKEVCKKLGWRSKPGSEETTPNMSQLGRLRELMGDCRKPGRRAAHAMLEAIRRDENRLKKWGGAAVVDKVQALFSAEEGQLSKIWDILVISDDEWNSALVTRTRDEALADFQPLALFYVLRVAIQHHKRNMERQEVGNGA